MCVCVLERLCCLSALCSAIRQHPAAAFLERSMAHLRQTAGVSRLSGFAVNKESMHDHVI